MLLLAAASALVACLLLAPRAIRATRIDVDLAVLLVLSLGWLAMMVVLVNNHGR